jgi:hypothetical protein
MLNTPAVHPGFSFVANATPRRPQLRRENVNVTDTGRQLVVSLNRSDYRLLRPLAVLVRPGDAERFLVTAADDIENLGLYGVGDTQQDAIDDFTSMLVDLFEDLQSSEAVLSRSLAQRLWQLRLVMEPRQPSQA